MLFPQQAIRFLVAQGYSALATLLENIAELGEDHLDYRQCLGVAATQANSLSAMLDEVSTDGVMRDKCRKQANELAQLAHRWSDAATAAKDLVDQPDNLKRLAQEFFNFAKVLEEAGGDLQRPVLT